MDDLDSFFAHYAERYMASDVDAISALYEAPLLAVREGRAIHLGDRTAVRQHLTEVMGAYSRSGAARADVAELQVLPLGKSSAAATVRWHVRGAGGELLKDFHTTYHLLLVNGEWRVLAYTNHDDEQLGRMADARLGQCSGLTLDRVRPGVPLATCSLGLRSRGTPPARTVGASCPQSDQSPQRLVRPVQSPTLE